MALSTSSNFAKPDDAFRAVVEAHRGLSDEQSADLDAALVLILANHIGDLDVLREAIAAGAAADGGCEPATATAATVAATCNSRHNKSRRPSLTGRIQYIAASRSNQSLASLECWVAPRQAGR